MTRQKEGIIAARDQLVVLPPSRCASAVLGRAASARVSLEQALKLARASLDPNHPGVAATLENLGRLELLEGRRDEARAQILEAYEIRASTLGPTHPDTVRTKELLALVQP